MVQVMNTNQDRVVLSWGSAENRDLHVIDKNDRSKRKRSEVCVSVKRDLVQYDSAEWEPAFLRQVREFLFFPLLPRKASK